MGRTEPVLKWEVGMRNAEVERWNRKELGSRNAEVGKWNVEEWKDK